MAYTQLFLDYLYQKDPYKINFFDQCGLKLPSASNRNYGHALRGERAVEFSRYLETANVTVNLMASMAGVCYANTVDGPADTVDFLNFFEEAYNSIDPITNEPCLKAEDIIVMDNAPTHHNAGGQILSEFLQQLGIELVYMPAYSPDFNPVEYVFGKLRTLMKYQFIDETSRNLKESLYLAIAHISAGDMAGYYRVTGYLNV
jgi:transposase